MRVQVPPPAPPFSRAARAPARRDESCRWCLQNVVLRPYTIGAIPKHLRETAHRGLLQGKQKPASRAECSTTVLQYVISYYPAATRGRALSFCHRDPFGINTGIV